MSNSTTFSRSASEARALSVPTPSAPERGKILSSAKKRPLLGGALAQPYERSIRRVADSVVTHMSHEVASGESFSYPGPISAATAPGIDQSSALNPIASTLPPSTNVGLLSTASEDDTFLYEIEVATAASINSLTSGTRVASSNSAYASEVTCSSGVMLCPICNFDISEMDFDSRNAHTTTCLDRHISAPEGSSGCGSISGSSSSNNNFDSGGRSLSNSSSLLGRSKALFIDDGDDFADSDSASALNFRKSKPTGQDLGDEGDTSTICNHMISDSITPALFDNGQQGKASCSSGVSRFEHPTTGSMNGSGSTSGNRRGSQASRGCLPIKRGKDRSAAPTKNSFNASDFHAASPATASSVSRPPTTSRAGSNNLNGALGHEDKSAIRMRISSIDARIADLQAQRLRLFKELKKAEMARLMRAKALDLLGSETRPIEVVIRLAFPRLLFGNCGGQGSHKSERTEPSTPTRKGHVLTAPVWSRSWQLDDDSQQPTPTARDDGQADSSSIETNTTIKDDVSVGDHPMPDTSDTNTIRCDHNERAVIGDAKDYSILDFHLTPMEPASEPPQKISSSSDGVGVASETYVSNLVDDLVQLICPKDGRTAEIAPHTRPLDWIKIAAISQDLITIEETWSLARITAERLLMSLHSDVVNAVDVVSNHMTQAVHASKHSLVVGSSVGCISIDSLDIGARKQMIMSYVQVLCQVLQALLSK